VGYVDGRPVARSVGLPYAPAVNMLMGVPAEGGPWIE
jgi:hypothetical protein